MADNKYVFFSRFKDMDQSVLLLFNNTINNYRTKYYNLWMNKYKWNGLNTDNSEQQLNYAMRQLWKEGSFWIRRINNTDMTVFCPFAINTYNYLDFPETVTLVNKRGAPVLIIPEGVQTVNQDGCLVYANSGHTPVSQIVDYYIERIAQVEVLLNNNLKLQNMPFIVGCDEGDKKKMQDIVTRVLNGEVAVFTEVGDIRQIQTLMTTAPYLLDKLKSYQVSLENELLTVLGINNSGTLAKKALMLVDEVNANNDVIDDYGLSITDEITRWLDRANTVLNTSFSIEAREVEDSTEDYEDASITEEKEESANA